MHVNRIGRDARIPFCARSFTVEPDSMQPLQPGMNVDDRETILAAMEFELRGPYRRGPEHTSFECTMGSHKKSGKAWRSDSSRRKIRIQQVLAPHALE